MNWHNIISELEASGMSQAQIARAVPCAQPYISQLKSGVRKSPGYAIGAALVEMHRKHCGKRKAGKAA
jgi:transcriptional regulator with XRE-family HTH domain